MSMSRDRRFASLGQSGYLVPPLRGSLHAPLLQGLDEKDGWLLNVVAFVTSLLGFIQGLPCGRCHGPAGRGVPVHRSASRQTSKAGSS